MEFLFGLTKYWARTFYLLYKTCRRLLMACLNYVSVLSTMYPWNGQILLHVAKRIIGPSVRASQSARTVTKSAQKWTTILNKPIILIKKKNFLNLFKHTLVWYPSLESIFNQSKFIWFLEKKAKAIDWWLFLTICYLSKWWCFDTPKAINRNEMPAPIKYCFFNLSKVKPVVETNKHFAMLWYSLYMLPYKRRWWRCFIMPLCKENMI